VTSPNSPEVLEHFQSHDPRLLDALTGLNTDASRVMVQRTRRAVRDAALSAMQVRRIRRRNAGIATLAALAFLVLVSPALWSFADELFRGEFVSDMAPMVTLLVALVLSGVLTALVASAKSLQPFRHGRRNT
jgi:TRAP-type C4-dicarboxylate transport system permease small subunit